MFVCILGGIGTAGVPAGSLPVVALICAMVGVPAEGIGLILGVDRFLDMCRTTLNVTGDLMLATRGVRRRIRTPRSPGEQPPDAVWPLRVRDASAAGHGTIRAPARRRPRRPP